MHSSIYREFDVSFSSREEPGNPANPEVAQYVTLREKESGSEFFFKLHSSEGCSPERWIEQQVLRRFPDSAAAHHLRATYGLTRWRLKPGWAVGFGERAYTALADGGPRFWVALIPALPSVLYSAMTLRATVQLRELRQPAELRTLVKTLHEAWRTVLTDAAQLALPMDGMQRLALDLSGWETKHLQSLGLLELGQLKEKAHFARLALDFLTDEDWVRMLTPSLVPATA